MPRRMPYGKTRTWRTATAAAFRGQEGHAMKDTAYRGRGIEIEDDIVRLRRRQLEYEVDAAARARRAGPRWRRRMLLASVLPATVSRRRSQQPSASVVPPTISRRSQQPCSLCGDLQAGQAAGRQFP
jgi:hypothetical protein